MGPEDTVEALIPSIIDKLDSRLSGLEQDVLTLAHRIDSILSPEITIPTPSEKGDPQPMASPMAVKLNERLTLVDRIEDEVSRLLKRLEV